ncbi:hypothetical protein J3459_017547 [Metarhizium acridum]|nr:hypothetical protein J3459_017547 [Metarhizium acridum]
MSQQECAVLTHPRKELLPQCQLLVLQEDIQFKEEASHSRTRGRPGCQQCQRLRLHFRFHLGMEPYVSGSFSNFRNHSFFPSFGICQVPFVYEQPTLHLHLSTKGILPRCTLSAFYLDPRSLLGCISSYIYLITQFPESHTLCVQLKRKHHPRWHFFDYDSSISSGVGLA